jgi:hypothetical protein
VEVDKMSPDECDNRKATWQTTEMYI